MSNAFSLLQDILSLCNEAPESDCAHVTLSHVTSAEGYEQSEQVMLADLHYAWREAGEVARHNQNAALEMLGGHVSHVLAVAVALGYAIGSGHAFESVLMAEIIVPDSLAGVDFLEAG